MITKQDERWIHLMKIGHCLGCHQLPERSFSYKGYQFPVCARCTGVIIAFPLSIYCAAKKRISSKSCVLMCFVMLLDWLLQFLNIKESTNNRRLITGFIGGLGFHTLWFRGQTLVFRKLGCLFDGKQEPVASKSEA